MEKKYDFLTLIFIIINQIYENPGLFPFLLTKQENSLIWNFIHFKEFLRLPETYKFSLVLIPQT